MLYIVATPIGNLSDISARAIDTLKSVDIIAAEDTRHSQKLLTHLGISTHLIALHQHNEVQASQRILKLLEQGKSMALISDAGTPLISDPGYKLIKIIREQGYNISPIPGPCALATALSASGLPVDKFVFLGFLSSKTQRRQTELQRYQFNQETLVLYESPHRILESLSDCQAILGSDRPMVLARELTKIFETIKSDTIANIINWLASDTNQQRGEFVLIFAPCPKQQKPEINLTEIARIFKLLNKDLPTAQAAKLTAKILGVDKKLVYSAHP